MPTAVLERGSRKVDRKVPVSYTHLDVYKRQIWDYFVNNDVKSVTNPDEFASMNLLGPVSYTHLSAYWDKIMETVKTWGMNFIRCHSYCPPEAAFEAANRAGVYLQIECDMWNVVAPDAQMNNVLWEELSLIHI